MQNATTVIVAEGALDIHAVKTIAKAIDALIDQKQLSIIIDWAKAEWINPLAIGVLLARRHELVNDGGDLRFCRMKPEVRKIFSRFRVDEFFEIYATLEDAIDSFDEEWQSGDECRAM